MPFVPLDQPVRLSFPTFSDAEQTTPADPTTVTVTVKDPAGVETTYTLAASQVVRESVGVFHLDYTPTVSGHYSAHWVATGAVTTSQDIDFDVEPKYGTLVSPTDFAEYLNNASVANDPRARSILRRAQRLCESVVKPLPDGAEDVVLDVAERAYANPLDSSSSEPLFSEGVGPFSTSAPGVSGGGLYLTQSNTQTLRRLAGKGGAFTIDTTPANAGTGLPWWDTSGALVGDWDVPT